MGGPNSRVYPGKCEIVSNSSMLVLSIAWQFVTDDDDESILDWIHSDSTWGLKLNKLVYSFEL